MPNAEQVLVFENAEIEHEPSHLSPKAIAAAIGALVAVVILNALVLLLTGELPLDTLLPTLGTGAAAVVAAYIKREILPLLSVPIPRDTTLVDDETEAVDRVTVAEPDPNDHRGKPGVVTIKATR